MKTNNGNVYHQIATLQDQIDALEGQKQTLLNSALNGRDAIVRPVTSTAAGSATGGKRVMSPEAKAKIAAAARARWAKIKGTKGSAAGSRGGAKRKMSPAARKRISDASKARWAKYRAAQGQA
jgi:hypothetical protein